MERQPIDKKNENVKHKVLSLFSGCGGMDLGFEGGFEVLAKSVNLKMCQLWGVKQIDEEWVKLPATMFKTIFANDIKPEAKAAWCNYFEKSYSDSSVYHLESIVDLVKRYKSGDLNVFPDNVDIVTGGFPCQDFSVAGKRLGFDSLKSHDGSHRTLEVPSEESRGQLYMWMREVISITKPKVFYAENVKGLATLSDVKEIIQNDFATICDGGYLVVPARVLLAANFGVPQSRERIIFIGFRRNALLPQVEAELSKTLINEEYDPYPTITHQYKAAAPYMDFVTTQDAFCGLIEPEFAQDIDQQKYSMAKYMAKGQGNAEICLNKIGPTIRAEHHGNIEFRRLSAHHGGKHYEELDAGLRERRLTIRECARLQTFPDTYEFVIPGSKGNKNVSASAAYKLIGNAVPPLLGFCIAKRLEDNWNKYFK